VNEKTSPPFRARAIPRIIGHRGACGRRPEHTLSSYELAFDLGADAIELDLVPTRDGHLIARHDNELSITTDVASRSEFGDRRRTKIAGGMRFDGWFTEDFTVGEIRTLRARERFSFRSHAYDGLFGVPLLSEILTLVCARQRRTGHPQAVILELKHPAYFASIGLPFEAQVLRTLAEANLPDEIEICIESFEPEILKNLSGRRTKTQICQLIDDPQVDAKFAMMLTPSGLAQVRTYADTIGVWKRVVVPVNEADAGSANSSAERLGEPTSLVNDAHDAKLFVEAWTFRDEPRFLAADYAGDPLNELRQFLELGVDGLIADCPGAAMRVRDTFLAKGS